MTRFKSWIDRFYFAVALCVAVVLLPDKCQNCLLVFGSGKTNPLHSRSENLRKSRPKKPHDMIWIFLISEVRIFKIFIGEIQSKISWKWYFTRHLISWFFFWPACQDFLKFSGLLCYFNLVLLQYYFGTHTITKVAPLDCLEDQIGIYCLFMFCLHFV